MSDGSDGLAAQQKLLHIGEQLRSLADHILVEESSAIGGERLIADTVESAFNFTRQVDKKPVNISAEKSLRQVRQPLPDPALIRKMIKLRELRKRYFEPELFADPAWDMILDLVIARAESRRISVTSLCLAAAVPPSTALRWINRMVDMGIFERVEDDQDKRRAFIALSDSAAAKAAQYFADFDHQNSNVF